MGLNASNSAQKKDKNKVTLYKELGPEELKAFKWRKA